MCEREKKEREREGGGRIKRERGGENGN